MTPFVCVAPPMTPFVLAPKQIWIFSPEPFLGDPARTVSSSRCRERRKDRLKKNQIDTKVHSSKGILIPGRSSLDYNIWRSFCP